MEERNQLMIVLICGVLAALSALTLKNYVAAGIVLAATAFAAAAWLISRRWVEE